MYTGPDPHKEFFNKLISDTELLYRFHKNTGMYKVVRHFESRLVFTEQGYISKIEWVGRLRASLLIFVTFYINYIPQKWSINRIPITKVGWVMTKVLRSFMEIWTCNPTDMEQTLCHCAIPSRRIPSRHEFPQLKRQVS